MPAQGGCSCRFIRYRLNARPMFVHCCHCTWCQRETGSAFAVNVLIETANIDILSGQPARITLPSASGKGQVLQRCPSCGVTLWSNYADAGEGVLFVRTGTLDDSSIAPPDIHIYTSSKRPWVILPNDVPAVAEFYQLSDYWPADSIARFKAARSGVSAAER